MKRTPVSSSSLRAVGYDEAASILEVEFVDGGVYEYSNVPAKEYTSLMAASSIGSYFATHIKKGGYSCRRLSR
ncbi:MAG: hypothetical protein QOE70_544 [Chthoniobacter sp.]|jgi:hypothetical protein|nr:hypothetical protein [Chthoniobacter sp.]